MANIVTGVYLTKNAFTITFTDGTDTTPLTLVIEAYDNIPNVPKPKIIENLMAVIAQGQAISFDKDDDSVEFPDFELSAVLMDKNVDTSKHAILEWFNNKKGPDGTTPLVTTNDGKINIIRTSTGVLEEKDVPDSFFMCDMTIAMDNGKTGKALTEKYRVGPISAEISSDKWAKVTAKMKIYSIEPAA